jgi:hypothetical protein
MNEIYSGDKHFNSATPAEAVGQPKPVIPDKDLNRIIALFAGHEDAHGTHGEPEQKGLKWDIHSTARTLRGPVTTEFWRKHLSGETPLGVIPIRKDSTCSWGSIDVDDYVSDLLTLVARVEQDKLPLVPCRSKSGGLHLFLFLTEPAPAEEVQAALKSLASLLGAPGSEIFPKQTKLSADRDDLGNWMVMPYFGQTYDGKLREQVGLRKTGTELTLGQFLDAAEAARVEPSSLERWARQKAKRASPASRAGPGPSDEPFADGPPCLQAMVREGGVPSGGQNNALLNMGTYYKKADPNGWKERLHKANNEFLDPPGSFDGLQSTINSLDKKGLQLYVPAGAARRALQFGPVPPAAIRGWR